MLNNSNILFQTVTVLTVRTPLYREERELGYSSGLTGSNTGGVGENTMEKACTEKLKI